MAQRRKSTNITPQDDEVLQDFFKEASELAKAVIELKTDLRYLRETLTPIIKLFQGTNGKESLATRIAMLEDGVQRLCDKKVGDDEFDKQITELKTSLENAKRDLFGTIEDVKRPQEAIKTDVSGLKDHAEAQKASWKKHICEFLKWIGAIISAYVVFRLTGK